MNEITTHVYTHMVVLYSGLNVPITEKAFAAIDAILKNGNIKHINLDGTLVATSNISEICSTAEYWRVHPDEAPKATASYFVSQDEPYETIEQMAEKNKENMSSLLRGLKQYCDEHPEAKKARAFFDAKYAKFKARWKTSS